ILAVTFTNKAAGELKERVARLLVRSGTPSTSEPLGCTFHSICARILRREIGVLGQGYSSRFTIYDQADSLKLIKECLRGVGRSVDDAGEVQARISAAKNTRLATAEEHAARPDLPADEAFAARIRRLYDERLRRNNALDFDDLLRKTVELLRLPSVAGFYASKYRCVLVDEYQDTNRLQFELIRLLCAAHRNVCVVGDDAQGIYGFRGADLRIILNFERLFPGARTIKLERNYRSTGRLVQAANFLIAHNRTRIPKAVYTENYLGEPISLYAAGDEHDEAEFVARETTASLAASPSARIGVLYRTNTQSRPLEVALGRSRVPYNLVGGLSLYDRKEVKDLFSYLRLAANPDDELAFERAIMAPPRGIGQKTLDCLASVAAENRCSRWTIAARLVTAPLA
ncbi:MAG: ATP-dependent helicase, partial [Blastocatellia bacterium]